jgi:hypothetical protein
LLKQCRNFLISELLSGVLRLLPYYAIWPVAGTWVMQQVFFLIGPVIDTDTGMAETAFIHRQEKNARKNLCVLSGSDFVCQYYHVSG